jgi:hypothetical protein
MHGIGAVEPVQSGRRVVTPREAVTGRTARASAIDRREVERRDDGHTVRATATDRREVERRDDGRTVRASATDRREVEQQDGASGCTT